MKPLFALALLAVAACATPSTTQPPRKGPVALGETAYVNGPLVRPERVIEDSRCPMNARCVWAGRVVVRVAILSGRRETLELVLGEPQPVADGALTLVSATPEREAGKAIGARDYRFAFEFQGGL